MNKMTRSDPNSPGQLREWVTPILIQFFLFAVLAVVIIVIIVLIVVFVLMHIQIINNDTQRLDLGQSKLDLKMFKGGYEYDLIASRLGFLGFTLDVLLADTFVQLKAPDLAVDEKYDATLPVPMIGLSGRVIPIKWVSLTGKISGLPMGGYGYILDAEASLDINPVKYVGISFGYRLLRMDLEYDDNKADFKLDGPFAALKVRF